MPPTTRGGRTSKTFSNASASVSVPVPTAAVVAPHKARSASKRSAQQSRTQSDDEKDMSTRERKRQRTDVDENAATPLEVVVVRQPRAPRRSRSKNARDKRRARRALAASQAASTSSASGELDQQLEQEQMPAVPGPSQFKDNTHEQRPVSAQEPQNDAPHKDVSPGISEMEAELARLRRQLLEKEQVIDRQHAALSAVHSTLQCQVCLEMLSRPFVLSKCGHVCCQSCLESWFTHCPQGDDGFEGIERPLHARRKTCPHCRQSVHARPIQLYLVKSLVGIMDVPNILDKLQTRAATREPSQAPAVGDEDPFKKFFPPERPAGGLIIDDEDGGVQRCPNCFYEVYDGRCHSCGRVYDDALGGADWDESGGEDEPYDDSEGSLDEFIEYDDGHLPGHAAGRFRHFVAHFVDTRPLLDQLFGGDGDEDGHHAMNALYIHSEDEHGLHEVDDDDDDDDDDDRFQEALETVEQPTDDEEEEEEAVRRPRRAPRVPAARANVIEISDDEDEESDLDEYHSRAAAAVPSRTVRRVVYSDEEDEEGAIEDDAATSLHSLSGSESDGSERGSSVGEEYWSGDVSGGRIVREESDEDEDQW